MLAYRPQLFQRTDELLIFPGKELENWHSQMTELIDGIYQVNAKNLLLEDENNDFTGEDKGKSRYVDIFDWNLTMGLLTNINEELENLFNPDRELNFSYYYLSTMDGKYKKRRGNWYTRHMHKIDRKVFKVTPQIRYIHLMEILDDVHKDWSLKKGYNRLKTERR